MRILATYSILICLISLTVRAADVPEGRWLGIINCNHERKPFALEIHNGNADIRFHNYLYKGPISYGDKSLRLTISAKRSDGTKFDENLYLSTDGKHLTGTVKENCQIGAYNKSYAKIKVSAADTKSYAQTVKFSKVEMQDIQYRLKYLAYDPGPIDGTLGPKTIGAMKSFAADKNLDPTNLFSDLLIKQLYNASFQIKGSIKQPFQRFKKVEYNTVVDNFLIVDLQKALIKSGVLLGNADGIYGAKTEKALLDFMRIKLNLKSGIIHHEQMINIAKKLNLRGSAKVAEGQQYYRKQAVRYVSGGMEKTLHVFWRKNDIHKSHKKLPCRVNFSGVGNSAYPRTDFDLNYNKMINRCVPSRRGKTPVFFERDGTSFSVPYGTAILAISDLEFVSAIDYGAKYRCYGGLRERAKGSVVGRELLLFATKVEDPRSPGTFRKCQSPYDGIEIIFKIKKTGELVKYYHLSSTPVVPGFGKRYCSVPIMKDRTNWHTRSHAFCGGARKKNYKKGDVIGYSGAVGKAEHFGWNIFRNGQWLIAPEDQTEWENIPTKSKFFLFPIPPTK